MHISAEIWRCVRRSGFFFENSTSKHHQIHKYWATKNYNISQKMPGDSLPKSTSCSCLYFARIFRKWRMCAGKSKQFNLPKCSWFSTYFWPTRPNKSASAPLLVVGIANAEISIVQWDGKLSIWSGIQYTHAWCFLLMTPQYVCCFFIHTNNMYSPVSSIRGAGVI